MPRSAVSVVIDCDHRLIMLRWRVKIMGDGATAQLIAALQRDFLAAFNTDPAMDAPFKIGNCDVLFDFESIIYDVGNDPGPNPAASPRDRDTIVIKPPAPGGHGSYTEGNPQRGGKLQVNPPNRREWNHKLINEIGHAFGLTDPPGGEWNFPDGPNNPPSITPEHIKAMVEACTTNEQRRRINSEDCCSADLRVSRREIRPREEGIPA